MGGFADYGAGRLLLFPGLSSGSQIRGGWKNGSLLRLHEWVTAAPWWSQRASSPSNLLLLFSGLGTEPRVSCILYHGDTYSLSVSIRNLPGPLRESISMASAIHSSGLRLTWHPHPVPLESGSWAYPSGEPVRTCVGAGRMGNRVSESWGSMRGTGDKKMSLLGSYTQKSQRGW